MKVIIKVSLLVVSVLFTSSAVAQWGGMPWGGQQQAYAPPQQNFGQMMPWGGSQQRQVPQRQNSPWGGMMPFGAQQQPVPQAPASPWGNMMPFGAQQQAMPQAPASPWGNMMPLGQQQSYAPQRSASPWGGMGMMPGMDDGIRTMMAPGKVMAEEATPGMYMKPTWQR